MVVQLVECGIWDAVVAGSSPVHPTSYGRFDKLVKSSPFQGGVTGSSPVPTTNASLGEWFEPPVCKTGYPCSNQGGGSYIINCPVSSIGRAAHLYNGVNH